MPTTRRVNHRSRPHRRRVATALTTLASTLLCGLAATAGAAPMKLADYLALSGPPPSLRVAYGGEPSQYAELFRPDGDGPFPVVVLLHGGCWVQAFGGIEQMHNVAGALARAGIAVWNVEYRRVDEEGGGYPGTFRDVELAIDRLAFEAERYQLDLRHVVAVGHSAGGQLAQWQAGRARLPTTSPLHTDPADTLVVRDVISLGDLADLRRERRWIATKGCKMDVGRLTGTPTAARPDVDADTNAAELMPNGSATVLINGALDKVSPPAIARRYAARARAAGDSVRVVVLPRASHYDEIAATSPAWPTILGIIRKTLGMDPLVAPGSPAR